jgi:predicted ATP-grasp superfamily ATP-dependent carboligase
VLSLALVVDREGAIVARFQERALRTWPPEAGSFALTVSERPDPQLFERAGGLLRRAGYCGMAQLDLILTRDGPVLLDANTRFYACLPTALRAGVNLPAAWHAVATGTAPPGAADYAGGVRFRWLESDWSAAFSGHGRRLLQRPRRGTVGAMWQSNDPVASALLAFDAVATRAGRRLPWR